MKKFFILIPYFFILLLAGCTNPIGKIQQNMIVRGYNENNGIITLTLTDKSKTLTATQQFSKDAVTIKIDNNSSQPMLTKFKPTIDIISQKINYTVEITASKEWVNENITPKNGVLNVTKIENSSSSGLVENKSNSSSSEKESNQNMQPENQSQDEK